MPYSKLPRPGYVDREAIVKAAEPEPRDGGPVVITWAAGAVVFWLFVAFIVVGLVVVL